MMRGRLLELGHRSLIAAVAAVGLVLIAASLEATAVSKAAPAPVAPGVTAYPDNDPSCSAFSTVVSYVDPYGATVFQTIPVVGNPFVLFNQCINICSAFPVYGVCVQGCPIVQQQLYPFGPLICPGPPDKIMFAPKPDAVSCGSASNLELAILDRNGLRVSDGTQVLFNTTLGYISTTNDTEDGLSHTSLTIPPKQSGSALVTATAGAATAQKLIQVTCP
ncbi:MAG TPA: hypothetical protein VJB57_01125 [Dehalococcoidia bacterium]|nr:hypothetical protein [Dehalococcoidia bacterium]